MAKVLLVSDDLTGALDAGVCLLPAGVVVSTSPEGVDRALLDSCPSALAVNADTRHLSAGEAGERVSGLVGLAREAGVACVVKKTDSALRGNVGAELAAAWRASGLERLHFIPALPEMGRVTRGGVHYVDGVPVSESRFGRDPFEPVCSSDVAELLAGQTEAPVTVVGEGEPLPLGVRGIVVYDVTSAESMLARVRELEDALYREGVPAGRSMLARVRELEGAGELGLVAGCSGVTSALARVLGLAPERSEARGEEGNLLVVCGSVNQTSRAQCAYAAAAGAPRLSMGAREKCDDSWLDGPDGRAFVARASELWARVALTVIDGSGLEDLTGLVAPGADVRQVVADHIGALLVRICERGVRGRVLVMGGDILASFLAQTGVGLVRPLVQPAPGIVGFELSHAGRELVIFSKSGGFGNRELFVDMAGRPRESVKECAHA